MILIRELLSIVVRKNGSICMTNMKRRINAWNGIGAEREKSEVGTGPAREGSLARKVGNGMGAMGTSIGERERQQCLRSCILLVCRCLT